MFWEKMLKTLHQKKKFARWQAILSILDFDIEFIKGNQNRIPDFLTHEFLQNPNHNAQEKASTATSTHKSSKP